MTELIDLYVIARLDAGDSAADLYSCEVYYDTGTGACHGRAVESWWESVRLDPTVDASLEALDQALASAGYARIGEWRRRVTSSGAVRYFADATTCIEEL
ncbi:MULTISPECIES: hypothetical protein [Nocardia]|uniref:hypothetical protein n=1 Tax=Nocardia TaxID=1817 RepID=UPI0004A704AA|nr:MULTISPECIES: hypothetical protein [Nocardia]